MIDKPEFLKSGEIARLIPVISDSRKEQRATSVLLSVFSAVPSFTDAVLSPLGTSVSQRTAVNTFTEIVLEGDKATPQDRPDGLIIIEKGKTKWTAFVEAKIGRAQIEKDQIERYLKLAKDNSIDAVISISNEFVARPTHHPFSVSKTLTSRVDWFHVSWTSILTEAILLHENAELTDPEQAFLIREFVRFFSHDSAGVTGYTQMPPCWNDVVKTFQIGGNLKKNSEDVEAVVAGWHQETREISLQLSQYLSRKVEQKLSKHQAADPALRVSEDASLLCEKKILKAEISIPDTASNMFIKADLKSRAIHVSMVVEAPRDKKTTKARLNWILRQLKNSDPEDVVVRIRWASRASDTDVPLTQLREAFDHHGIVSSNAAPKAFEVIYNKAQAGRFSGRKTFIEDIEKICPHFYENIGQHLKAWQPTPPKPKTKLDGEDSPTPTGDTPRGNEHTSLLEVPEFLRRMEAAHETQNNLVLPKSSQDEPKRASRFPSFLNHS